MAILSPRHRMSHYRAASRCSPRLAGSNNRASIKPDRYRYFVVIGSYFPMTPGSALPHSNMAQWSFRAHRDASDWRNPSCSCQSRRAASIVAMSIFFGVIIASKARFASRACDSTSVSPTTKSSRPSPRKRFFWPDQSMPDHVQLGRISSRRRGT